MLAFSSLQLEDNPLCKLPNVHARFLSFTANWKVVLAEILTVPLQKFKAARLQGTIQC